MISIRLSDEEYREIKQRCSYNSDLTVSDFVRAAMIDALESPDQLTASAFEIRLAQFKRRLDRLETRIEELTRPPNV